MIHTDLYIYTEKLDAVVSSLETVIEYAWRGSSVYTQEVKKHILLCRVLHKLHNVEDNISSWLKDKKSCYQGKFVE